MHIRTDMHKKKTQAMPQHMRSEVGELLERIKELSALTIVKYAHSVNIWVSTLSFRLMGLQKLMIAIS